MPNAYFFLKKDQDAASTEMPMVLWSQTPDTTLASWPLNQHTTSLVQGQLQN